MSTAVEFDPATHSYTVAGRKFPSVTQIIGEARLENFDYVNAGVLDAARMFGRHVHEATHLYDIGELDIANLDHALVPFVEAWGQFLDDTGAVVISSEQPLVHEKLGYAGTPDRILSWGNRIVLPDIKATAAVPRTVGCQTAAYAKAYAAERRAREPHRYCIHLTPGGRGKPYKSHVRNDPADFSLFLSALNCYRFRHAT